MASNTTAPLKLMLSLALVLIILSSVSITDAQGGLQIGFYSKSCPNAEAIIFKEMKSVISTAPSLMGPLLRLHFHDCFVRGCDGSVLLDSVKNNMAEKTAIPNQSLRGFGVIDGVKAKLEKACPGVVSCADIVAIVARDVVTLANGPTWKVLTGRRDGRKSRAVDALNNLPPPSSNFTSLKASFAALGLDTKDLVVLSGAHTIGTSHCSSFTNRLYNFTGKGDTDKTLDQKYIPNLKKKCSATDVTTLVEMDPGSFTTFDLGYYMQVSKRRGLFESDEALLDDKQSKAYILRHALGFSTEFFNDFGVSMIKMGSIGVLTGKQGEIRKKCTIVN